MISSLTLVTSDIYVDVTTSKSAFLNPIAISLQTASANLLNANKI
jgi:hypothetical protein